MNEQKYTIEAPIGNVVAPTGPITEQELRDFGASMSADDTWKEKFIGDPIETVLEYFRVASFIVKKV